MSEVGTRFFLALDCGAIDRAELAAADATSDFSKVASYRRAKAVWQQIQDHVIRQGSMLSCRTMGSGGRFYVIAYGDAVKEEVQLRVFRLMDRYRQEHIAEALTFARLASEHEEHLLRMRQEARDLRASGTYRVVPGVPGISHETHAVRHQEIESEYDITPIEPPFPSVPLYREKPSGEPKVKSSRPFLERYYLTQRLLLEHPKLTRTRQKVGLATIEATRVAKKYLFTESAMALVASLLHLDAPGETKIHELPATHVFIELASPLDLGVYQPIHGMLFLSLSAIYEASLSRTFAPLRPREVATWGLALLDKDGSRICEFAYERGYEAWRLPEIYQCPSEACKQLCTATEMLERGIFTNWQACPDCQTMGRYFSHWFPITLLAIAGEFAEEAEATPRTITETITRKEKRPGSGKYDEKREQVTFQLVTFDASVKRREQEREPREAKQGASWLDLAVERGTVLYVRRHFGKSTRMLDPEKHPRWKFKREVPVKDYDKRVPMTLERLQRVITNVVASKYKE